MLLLFPMRLSAFCRQAHFAFCRRFFKNFALFLAKQKVACIIPRKGEVLPPFGRKEVNTMTPNRREFEKQCTFQKFCKLVLHNEACNAHEEIRRRRVREVTFSDCIRRWRVAAGAVASGHSAA